MNEARGGGWGGGGESEAKFKGHQDIQHQNNISIIIKLIKKITHDRQSARNFSSGFENVKVSIVRLIKVQSKHWSPACHCQLFSSHWLQSWVALPLLPPCPARSCLLPALCLHPSPLFMTSPPPSFFTYPAPPVRGAVVLWLCGRAF